MKKTIPHIPPENTQCRRQENRLSMHFPSLLIQQEEEIYATVVNMSENGIGFMSAVEVSVNDEISLNFECVKDYTKPRVILNILVHTCHEVALEYYIGGRVVSKPLNYTKFFKVIELGACPFSRPKID
jgi:hypothetical protein